MDFLGMGMGEMLLVFIVAIIIWGPGRIVEISRTLGKTVRALRKTTSELTAAVTREIDAGEKERPHHPTATEADQSRKLPDADTAEPGDTNRHHPNH